MTKTWTIIEPEAIPRIYRAMLKFGGTVAQHGNTIKIHYFASRSSFVEEFCIDRETGQIKYVDWTMGYDGVQYDSYTDKNSY